MKVVLDLFEMYCLLESCLRGSHLRSGTILRFVDEWYPLFTSQEREKLYKDVLELIYSGKFEPRFSACGADTIFMARYNPDNHYKVTLSDGEQVDAFLMDSKYYVKSDTYCDTESIKNIEKI